VAVMFHEAGLQTVMQQLLFSKWTTAYAAIENVRSV